MTTPAAGFPDYQQYSSWRSSNLVTGTVHTGAGGSGDIGPYPMANYAGIRVALRCINFGSEIFVYGCDDLAKTNSMLLASWVVVGIPQVKCTIPVPTNYVFFSFFAEASGASDIAMVAQAVNIATDKPHYRAQSNVLTALNQTLIANGQVQWFPTEIMPGPAGLWIDNQSVSPLMQVSIRTKNKNSTDRTTLYQFTPTVRNFNTNIILPADSHYVSLDNFDTVSHTISFGLSYLAAST